MNKYNNSKLTSNAQKLRKTMTKQGRYLWYDFLKSLPQTINRQKVIGKYIADFYCSEVKIIIELDGSQHYYELGKEHDLTIDKYMEEHGIKVLRYTNLEIKQNFEGVCEDISREINMRK